MGEVFDFLDPSDSDEDKHSDYGLSSGSSDTDYPTIPVEGCGLIFYQERAFVMFHVLTELI